MKKARYCSVGITVVLGLFIFAVFQLFPFSHLTVAWCDMKQQVIPLIIEFKEILSGNGNFFLNLQNAGGMSFIGVFFFFLSSPFTFLLTLFSGEMIYKMVNIAVLLKMAAAAFTSSLFFERHYKTLHWLQITALSVSYAFCGYTLMYFQNIVWLDMVYLFPLIMYGMFSMIRTGKTLLFTVSFSLAIVIHFYLTYMVSLYLIFFTVIFVLLCVKKERRSEVLFLTAKSVLWSFGFTAAVWVPLLLQYTNSARGNKLTDSLASGGILARWETTSITLLFTGLALASLIVSLFAGIRKVRRFTALVSIFFLTIIPLVLEPINKMWHTGSYQAFPSRYGFLVIFTALIIAAEVISALNESVPKIPDENVFTRSLIFAVCGVLLLVNAIRLLITERDSLSVYMRKLWFTSDFLAAFLQFFFPLVAVMVALMLFYKAGKLRKAFFNIFLCVLIVIESFFCASCLLGFAANDITFNEEVLELSDRVDDEDLYRVKQNRKNFDVNIVGSLGYATLNHYTSFTDELYHRTMKRLGYSSYWMEVSSVGGTELSDIFLGNRYTVFQTFDALNKGQIHFYNERFALVETEPNASLGFMTASPIETFSQKERMLIQEELVNSLIHSNESFVKCYKPDNIANVSTDYDNVYSFHRVDTDYTGVLYYHIRVDESETLYFDCFDQITTRLREVINGGCNVYVNGNKVEGEYPTQKNNGILCLGTFKNEDVLIEIELLKNINAASFGVYGISREKMEEIKANIHPVSMFSSGNSVYTECISENEDDYLVVSLPYHKGYSVKINGKKAELLTAYEGFMAVKLEPGENLVEFSYIPRGVIFGFILSLLTTAFMLNLVLLRKIKKKKLSVPVLKKIFPILFYVVFFAALFMVYLFPFAVRIIK